MCLDKSYSSSTVGSDTVARGGHDQTQGSKSHHQGKADPSIEHVQNLGQRHVSSSAHDRRNDTDQRHEGVRLEVACDVRIQAARDGLLEVVDEVQKEHPIHSLASRIR